MELNFSEEWRIIGPAAREIDAPPAAFAAAELAAVLGRMGCRPPTQGDSSDTSRIIVLDAGSGAQGRAGRFSWRASPDRVEIYGSDGAALLRGAYDFLAALGARWPAPGEKGERLPSGPLLALETESRASIEDAIPTSLVLGHGAYLEAYADYLLWAARVGYASVCVHVTEDALALEAAPTALYDSLRGGIASLSRRLGLSLELGFRFPDRGRGGEESLALAARAFADRAAAHPEIAVFHVRPGARSSVAEGSAEGGLGAARALAEALARVRPDAALSFLAEGDDAGLPDAILEGAALPARLELLWAPRRRSWGSALRDTGSTLNAASIALFRKTAKAWRARGGGRVLVLERYEDAFLFKGAVPPLSAVIEGDISAYRGSEGDDGADAIGLLCAGGRLPLAPRPNAALLPVLAADPARDAGSTLADWAHAAYRGAEASVPMLEYWRELEAAWAVDLDLREGETEVHAPASLSSAAAEPPSDWGDPRKAGIERLAAKRDRCEELFDRLRRAEAGMAESQAAETASRGEGRDGPIRLEADEYAISGRVLELNCARLSAYHELAAGDHRAAADIANLALSASAALRGALGRLPDPRARRETRLVLLLFYDLELRALRRANARSGLRRLLDLWYTRALTIRAARVSSRAYEPPAR